MPEMDRPLGKIQISRKKRKKHKNYEYKYFY